MRLLAGLGMSGLDVGVIEDLNDLMKLFDEKFEWNLSLHDAQNLYYELLKQYGGTLREEAEEVRKALYELGHALKFSDEILSELKG